LHKLSQQPILNIKPGNHAEIIFTGIPGRVFQARVKKVPTAADQGAAAPRR